MTTPLLTIAIPSHNHAKYIAQTIQSSLDQSFQDFEILIVDDASSDNSLEIIKSFKDPRIKLIELKTNVGVCETSNICIENCQTKYITLIASDDIMMPEKLAKQISFLEKNSDFGAVFSGMEIIDENNKINVKKTNKFTKIFEKENRGRYQWLNHFFHSGNCMAATTLLAKTEALRAIGGFDLSISQAHDFDLWVKLCLAGYEIRIIHEKLLQYRERSHAMNMSSSTIKTRTRLVFDNEKILENYLNIGSINEFYKIFPEAKILRSSLNKEEEEIVINYLLAVEALKNNNKFSHQQFALGLIHGLYKNQNSRAVIKNLFNFNLAAYLEIITKNPLGVLAEEKENPPIKRAFKYIEKTTLSKLKILTTRCAPSS